MEPRPANGVCEEAQSSSSLSQNANAGGIGSQCTAFNTDNVGNTGEMWDQVELVRLDMDSYVLRCTKTPEGAMSFQTPELSFMSIR